MIIHNGLEGYSGGQEIPEYEPGDPNYIGAVTVANLNDTNGDGERDVDQTEVLRAETTLTQAVAQGALSLAVASVAGYKDGDQIGIKSRDRFKTVSPPP